MGNSCMKMSNKHKKISPKRSDSIIQIASPRMSNISKRVFPQKRKYPNNPYDQRSISTIPPRSPSKDSEAASDFSMCIYPCHLYIGRVSPQRSPSKDTDADWESSIHSTPSIQTVNIYPTE